MSILSFEKKGSDVNEKKFTLIELIIVIVVIGTLAAMALPKFTGVVRNAKLSAMINDKEVLEKAMILYYQKYDKLPLLNEDQELIVLNNDISLIKMVQAKEVVREDMKTIYTSLQETLKHYNDSEENLYRIDISKAKNNLSKKLKYGYKKENKDFYVYSTKTNNVYYYNTMLNGDGEIQHSEFNTKLKESELVNKKFSYNFEDNNSIINNKPIVELTTNLSNLTNNSLIEWTYSFVDEDKEPAKISFILNDIEYDSFDKIPTTLKEGECTIKLKMQDSKGLWSNEINKSFVVNNIIKFKNNKMSFGINYSIKIGDDGFLYGWGYNGKGELGLGSYGYSTSPKKTLLPNNIKIISVSSGLNHTIAIGDDDNLYSWGCNDYGQLGIEGNNFENIPQKITLPKEVKPKSVFSGRNFNIVIGSDNNLYGWGDNRYGQLGLEGVAKQTTPILLNINIPNNESIKEVYVGGYHSMVLTNLNNLYAWGYNYYGQLGIGNNVDQITPKLVPFPKDVKPIEVSLGFEHSIAIGNDGNLYCWGNNGSYELGIEDNIYKIFYPQRVSTPNNIKVKSVFASWKCTFLIGEDDKLYSCGFNQYGQLGIGLITKKGLSQVSISTTVKADNVYIGKYNSFVIGDNNIKYAWGQNDYGQLGINNTANQYIPIKVELP